MNPFIERIVNGSSLATELTNISDSLLLVYQTALFETLNNYRQEKGMLSLLLALFSENINPPDLNQRMIGQERESHSKANCPNYDQYQNWSSASPNDVSHIVLQGAMNTSTSQLHTAYHKIESHNEYQHQILNIKIEYQNEIINVNIKY